MLLLCYLLCNHLFAESQTGRPIEAAIARNMNGKLYVVNFPVVITVHWNYLDDKDFMHKLITPMCKLVTPCAGRILPTLKPFSNGFCWNQNLRKVLFGIQLTETPTQYIENFILSRECICGFWSFKVFPLLLVISFCDISWTEQRLNLEGAKKRRKWENGYK